MPAGDLFIPDNSDYDDFNIDYRDEADDGADGGEDPSYPQYDFKDVIYSIRNNESRVLTLKKFLSAASGLTNRAGADPVEMAWSLPLTVLAILGVFYAVSAVAVLGYKYVLLTSGSTNGQAVALLPVAISFAVPLALAAVFLVGMYVYNGQINLGRLARGDLQYGLRHDFDGVDFMTDLAVGSSALLGLGWIASIML